MYIPKTNIGRHVSFKLDFPWMLDFVKQRQHSLIKLISCFHSHVYIFTHSFPKNPVFRITNAQKLPFKDNIEYRRRTTVIVSHCCRKGCVRLRKKG